MAVIASLWPGPARRKSANGDAPLRQRTATTGAIVDFYYGYIDAVADYLFQNHALGEFTGCATNAPDDSQLRFLVVPFLRENPPRAAGAPRADRPHAVREIFLQ